MNGAFHRPGHRLEKMVSNYAKKFANTDMVNIPPALPLDALERLSLLENGNLALSKPGAKVVLSALPFHRSGHRFAFAITAILALAGCRTESRVEPIPADTGSSIVVDSAGEARGR